MLVVRSTQLQVMRTALRRRFEDRLTAHAQRYFPDVCTLLDRELQTAIQHSVERARSYGFAAEREVCKYLNLQFRFGRDFDLDPTCAWALPLLKGALPGPPKMGRLYSLGLEHEAEARGYFASTRGRAHG